MSMDLKANMQTPSCSPINVLIERQGTFSKYAHRTRQVVYKAFLLKKKNTVHILSKICSCGNLRVSFSSFLSLPLLFPSFQVFVFFAFSSTAFSSPPSPSLPFSLSFEIIVTVASTRTKYFLLQRNRITMKHDSSCKARLAPFEHAKDGPSCCPTCGFT